MEKNTDFEQERTRLTRRAWRVTGGYAFVLFVLGAFVVFGEEGVLAFRNMSPNEVGDLLAGVAGPVAFIWLVYGYFLQGIAIRQQAEELAQNTRALLLQEKALRAQVKELRNSVAHQYEIALAANAQAKAMLEAQKPAFSIRNVRWESSSLSITIYNAGGPASNLIVAGVFGEGKDPRRSYSFISKDAGVEVYFEDVIRPKMLEILGLLKVSYSISLEFEYGNGLRDTEFFDYVEDGVTTFGKFVNRKSILSIPGAP
jgi:hypothetical protein